MYKAGISIFNGLKDYNLEDNLIYMEKARDNGIEMVFSSAHINEADKSYQDLQICLKKASQLGMKLSLDISKSAYEQMDYLENLYALRLDYGFTDDDIIQLSQEAPFFIELNASTFSSSRFESLIAKGLNLKHIRVSFNYYPKPYTGHTLSFCKERITYYHQYGISVGAFLPSKVGHRPPLYQGLPSIEEHRYSSLDMAIEELKAIGIDEIYFGDAYASDIELKQLIKHQTEIIQLPIHLSDTLPVFYRDYLKGVYRIRPDVNDMLLRVSANSSLTTFPPFQMIERKRGDITIDNQDFLRYKGEINIVLQPLPRDERVNVVGHIEMSQIILDEIRKQKQFMFTMDDSKI
ncbi:MAG: MupG family TIM beta-alpha barrel fold protein [Prevotella sp.]|nr:MupG family TIM beta-alpha barrel fold protein [Staphylococcus sp.]MCM1350955.1 MupG family TIM beta-alpha barrel fold protein [Prevotella sp.]